LFCVTLLLIGRSHFRAKPSKLLRFIADAKAPDFVAKNPAPTISSQELCLVLPPPGMYVVSVVLSLICSISVTDQFDGMAFPTVPNPHEIDTRAQSGDIQHYLFPLQYNF